MNEASPLNRYQLAELGALLAEPARAAILLALMDGTMRPAGELADVAGVSAATASAHLKRLLEGGLLGLHEQGRHRYYRLANDDVAAWLEAMALPHATLTTSKTAPRDAALCRARTCYRHLAGQLGVALCEAWLQRGWLHAETDGLQLLPVAADALVRAGCEQAPAHQMLHLRGRGCLDWTERRLHLGGPLGVAITSVMLESGWLRRAQRNRALLPTPDGLRRLAELGIRIDP
ncbi:ArsR/SmtB family transcription factor [Dyella choica]|uniref:Transcriptional regulator n=1 Tax=Dyella choica TaxID=1927959 RepID=A0A3S0S9P1_9GAMM|nr:helix-turn-helix transcriptional regulator [Dyella choica]RUL74889.1 transcriptional regulator [Dyella choica]